MENYLSQIMYLKLIPVIQRALTHLSTALIKKQIIRIFNLICIIIWNTMQFPDKSHNCFCKSTATNWSVQCETFLQAETFPLSHCSYLGIRKMVAQLKFLKSEQDCTLQPSLFVVQRWSSVRQAEWQAEMCGVHGLLSCFCRQPVTPGATSCCVFCFSLKISLSLLQLMYFVIKSFTVLMCRNLVQKSKSKKSSKTRFDDSRPPQWCLKKVSLSFKSKKQSPQ